jgi:hypothetical protein
MRVIVTVTEGAAQELYAELASIPARQRAERLRSLATLGLMLVRNPENMKRNVNETNGSNSTMAGPGLSGESIQRQNVLKSLLIDDLRLTEVDHVETGDNSTS